MRTTQSGIRRLFTISGVVLLGIGLTILLAQVDITASRLADRFGIYPGEIGGPVPAAILSTVHAVQALAFDRSNVLSGLREMLLSCWPVILILSGAALLRGAFNGLARVRHNGRSAVRGEL
jgi:hypothetical protein